MIDSPYMQDEVELILNAPVNVEVFQLFCNRVQEGRSQSAIDDAVVIA